MNTALFLYPYSILVDSVNGGLYIGERNNIRRISPVGMTSKFVGSTNAGSVDGIGTTANFRDVRGLAFDSLANIYAVDFLSFNVRRITPAGQYLPFHRC